MSYEQLEARYRVIPCPTCGAQSDEKCQLRFTLNQVVSLTGSCADREFASILLAGRENAIRLGITEQNIDKLIERYSHIPIHEAISLRNSHATLFDYGRSAILS